MKKTILAGMLLSASIAQAQGISAIASSEKTTFRLEHLIQKGNADLFILAENNGLFRTKVNYFFGNNLGLSANYIRPFEGVSDFDLGITGKYVHKSKESFLKLEGNVYPIHHRAFLFALYRRGDWQVDNLTIYSPASTINQTSLLHHFDDNWSAGFESRFVDDLLDRVGVKIKWNFK